MVRIIEKIIGLIGRILDFTGVLAGVCVGVIGFIVTWGVITRYLGFPSQWADPFSVYIFIAASFLGAAYATKKGEHIRVDILIRRFPEHVRRILDILTSLAALFYIVLFAWKGFQMVQRSFQAGTTDLSLIGVPMFIPQAAMMLGVFLIGLALVRRILLSILAMAGYGNGLNDTPVNL